MGVRKLLAGSWQPDSRPVHPRLQARNPGSGSPVPGPKRVAGSDVGMSIVDELRDWANEERSRAEQAEAELAECRKDLRQALDLLAVMSNEDGCGGLDWNSKPLIGTVGWEIHELTAKYKGRLLEKPV